jgi:hypothetical protein
MNPPEWAYALHLAQFLRARVLDYRAKGSEYFPNDRYTPLASGVYAQLRIEDRPNGPALVLRFQGLGADAARPPEAMVNAEKAGPCEFLSYDIPLSPKEVP